MSPRNRSRPPAQRGPDWHALGADAVLSELGASASGLTEQEARARLARHGPNRLPSAPRRGPLVRFALQFHNVLIYVLLASAAVTAALAHWVDTAVILAVVVVNAAIGFVQEGRAERAVEAIRELLSPRALVLREGLRCEIPAEHLVPGDVVLLSSGDRVPADLRVIESRNLQVDEAALTGESVPVEKAREPVSREAALGDRTSMAYSGTLVTRGRGAGVVVATGARTEVGRISGMLREIEPLATPLTRKMGAFARWLTAAILAGSAATFAFGLLLRDYTATEMFLAVVALAVAAIPEGLPAILTIALAVGVQRMARRNAIIRRLPAVETLGSVTVICTDKTGTLTRNEMTVQAVVTAEAFYTVSGAGYAPEGGFFLAGRTVDPAACPDLLELARAGLLCNDGSLRETTGGWRLEGDPTEGALLALALKAGLDAREEARVTPRVDAIPFESEHRFMATLHHDRSGHTFACVKGAPERVLEMCAFEASRGGTRPLDLRAWHRRVDELAARGQRVLALAVRPLVRGTRELAFADVEQGLVLLGLVGMSDPPREEAISAVQRCRAAGIRVKMITGDHLATARAVGSALGIGDGTKAVSGAELDRMDDDAFARAAREVDVFARASPEHKLRLVRALQSSGEVVAMTGDGVNDAPALKRADIGIAMGIKGTEAAKEAAEMVLADDHFASIANAVEEGRTVYDNIRKAILFILPTNGGEAGVIVTAVLLGVALPITAVQILWVNTITTVTLALALAFEPPETDVMRRPPRDPHEPLLSGFLVWRIVLVSALLVAACFGLFGWALARSGSLEVARTAAVNLLVAGEMFYLFNTRRIHASALSREGLLGSRSALLAVGSLAAMQLLFTYAAPMNRWFGTAGLDGAAWAAVLGAAAAIFAAIEAEKALARRVRPRFAAARRALFPR